MYWYPKLELMLMIYVDAFKLAGPKKSLQIGWDLLRARIDMDGPSHFGPVLGCHHVVRTEIVNGKSVQTMPYDVRDCMRQCRGLPELGWEF